MPEFLSTPWLTDLDAVARSSTRLGELGARGALVVEQRVTATPAGDVVYHVALEATGGRVEPGAAPDPDLVLTTDYPTAVALHRGTTSFQRALADGLAKVQGDLVKLRARVDALTALDDVFGTVRATTTFPDLDESTRAAL